MNARLQRITKERDDCHIAIQDYRSDLSQLTNFNVREKAIGETKDAYSKISAFINEAEDERTKQLSTLN